MRILFSAAAWEEYHLLGDEDPKLAGKIKGLIAECQRHPFFGTGKPEPLKGNLKGWWSRRVSQEHRLVYRVTGAGAEQTLEIAQCSDHY